MAADRVHRGTVMLSGKPRCFPALGVALALLTFATPLLESFHSAAVRHVACPEDGELIDARPEAPHAHAQVTADAPELFAERDPAATNASENHGHCSIAQQAQVRAREGSRRIALRVPPDKAVPRLAFEPLRLNGFVLYRLAPKASPPA
ncbi:MAG TPA: hypothetical protein VMK66_15450 [Myxococcales bacterium]|nr:hypothetical protein [Myxococcales bacterium]